MKRRCLLILALLILTGCGAEKRAASPFAGDGSRPVLLAHRGMSQTFSPEGVENDTCTATRIYPPTHPYLENTLPSMQAAIEAGADVIELDIHPTTDGEFAIFHDWTVDCRTDGQGRTRDHSMAALKKLDIGYGYTADGGKTHPFRGKGVGLMPTLREVLKALPEQMLLIHIKSDDPAEGEQLADFLNTLPPARRRLLAVYGGQRPVTLVHEKVPDVLTTQRKEMQDCLFGSLLLGWTGHVPESCVRSLVLLPINYAPRFAGWPHDLVQRIRSVGSALFVAGDFQGGASTGIDSEADLQKLPPDYTGGIWTNEIGLIGKALKQRSKP